MLIDYDKVKVYQQDTLILDDVSFHADEGEFIYLIGKVGSGKSSLLKTFYCELDLYLEDGEKAEVLGRDLLKLRRHDILALRREMGIIFQDFQLLRDRDVFQNLRFVLRATGWKDKKKIEERIQEVLQAVEMTDKIHSMPHELSGASSSASPLHVLSSISQRSSSRTSLRATSIPRQPTISCGCSRGSRRKARRWSCPPITSRCSTVTRLCLQV